LKVTAGNSRSQNGRSAAIAATFGFGRLVTP
jgi:hypothetical protein